ncbi:MAG TPA: PqqD family protein [Xanthobacteraceae bacterium]|nr:PqqD family protein [Xanthobacteraceae bacterium]
MTAIMHRTAPRREAVAKRTGRLSKLRFYGDQFVLDTVSGRFYRLTPVAGFVLKALIAGTEQDRLADVVAQTFGADRATAERDVELFLGELSSLELIEQPAR